MPRRRIVIDHITIGVSDLAQSREFYRRALTPLGFSELSQWREGATAVVFGLDEAHDFSISTAYPVARSHVAFAADRREQVDAFYAAALEAGGQDNGPPGLRPKYSDGYYGAFVLDPDGYNVEAVHHGRA
jgi:catechol 2,3-dioxygenase-like lactoylglutathione lyase family enzyme